MIVLYNPRTASPGHQRLPLSLLRLGAGLEGRHPYTILDGNLTPEGSDPQAELLDALRDPAVEALGVTIMPGPQLQQAVPLLRRVRADRPDLTTIAGGYFPSLHREVCALDPAIDYVVTGFGEETFPELLSCLGHGGDPADIPGLAFARDGALVTTAEPGMPEPDDLPPIPYHRVDVERYVARTHLGRRTLSHHSSYGCPHRCNFCAVPVVSRGCWRGESASRLGEVTRNLVSRWGIDALEFHDNNFFVSEHRVRGYCETLLKDGLTLHWWGEGRIDTLLDYDNETWRLMARSGLRMVFLGAESGSRTTLGNMNKGGTLSPERTLAFVDRARRYGIVPELSFICGNPPDPSRDIAETIRFVREVKRVNPDTEIILYRYDPVPAAGYLWEEAEEAGFELPTTLDGWVGDHWARVHGRRSAEIPWLAKWDLRRLKDFETVLNAYYPTSTDARLKGGAPRLLLKLLSAWRYRLHLYRWPLELRALQERIRYQRPETSGF